MSKIKVKKKKHGLDLIPVASNGSQWTCEYGNEPSGYKNDGECFFN